MRGLRVYNYQSEIGEKKEKRKEIRGEKERGSEIVKDGMSEKK